MRIKLASLLVIPVLALIILLHSNCGMLETMSAEELKASIEIVDVETKWMSKYYQPWPPKLILVPVISFRVKNISKKPLRYINFNANFRFRADHENLGDCFLAAIRSKPILPGEKSEVIVLKSNYGIEGKNLASFKDNPGWRVVFVKLFAQSKGSQYAELGTWEVAQVIDFKEPEEVGKEDKR